MAFVSRPNLEDISFRQTTGATLTMSGTTNFVGTLKSKNVEINASLGYATGGTTGTSYVLTLMGSKIRLAPISGGGGSGGNNLFDSKRFTTRVGVPVVNVSGTTVQQFLEGYFFPAVPPAASLAIGTGGATRQFGDSTPGLLNWIATRYTNPITQIKLDTGGTGIFSYNVSPVTGNNQLGSIAYGLVGSDYAPPSNTSQKIRTYQLMVKTATETAAISTASITWRHKRFWFKSNTSYVVGSDALIQAILNAGSVIGSELSTTMVKTFSPITFSNEFFYYVFPVFFGTPSFTVNGLPNNAWGNSGTGTLFTINYTNTNGYSQIFNVAKSDQRLSASFNIVTS